MIIGIPKEIKQDEYRVGIVPSGVHTLKEHGHTVLIETEAGGGCKISDAEYAEAGATILGTSTEVFRRSEMILKVKEPQQQEYDLLREGQIVYAYLHLAPATELTKALLKKKVIAVAYETIQESDGSLPLLIPMSEVAGRMAVQVGSHFLEKTQGGRGVLLGGLPGVRRGRVTIIGAGTVGMASAKIAVGFGADVYLIDVDQKRLAYADDIFGNRVTTMMSNVNDITFSVVNSHLVVGGVLIAGAKAPKLVTADMVRKMKPGTVIVDVAIDQGGCVETSHPTTHKRPTFLWEEVIHYCVPNIPGAVPRTSTFGLTNVTLPYAVKIADEGIASLAGRDQAFAKGINLYRGSVTHEEVALAHGFPYTPVSKALETNSG